MKNLKSLIFGLAALCLAFALVFSVSAFKSNAVVLYQYTSNSSSEEDILDIENWQPVDENSPSCGTAGSLVCRYSFDGDMNDFQAFLENPTTTAAQINSNAESTKL